MGISGLKAVKVIVHKKQANESIGLRKFNRPTFFQGRFHVSGAIAPLSC